MFQSIHQFWDRISQMIAERPFYSGFLLGLAVAALVLFALFLFILIFRGRKLSRIVIPSEGGELRIDAKAVQAAVRTLAEKYPAFSVRKVGLYGKQKAFRIKVETDFNGGSASVSALASQFRNAIVLMMTEMLGTGKPAQVELEIRNSLADLPALSASAGSDENNDAPDTD